MTNAVKLTPAQRTALNTIAKHGGIHRSFRGAYQFRDGGTTSFDVPKAAVIEALITKGVLRGAGNGLNTSAYDEFILTDTGKALVS
ncbi:hypothetical protein ACWGJ9_09530 [Curtobacterium citreum]